MCINSQPWFIRYKSGPQPLLDSARLVIRRLLGESVTQKVNQSVLPEHLKRIILLKEGIR